MNNMTNEEVETVIDKLQKYINLDGTELGEVGKYLFSLWESYRDYLSPEFVTALELELADQLNHFEQNCEIVEREFEIKRVEKVKELVWKI